MDFQNLRAGDTITVSATIIDPIDRDGEYYVEFPNCTRKSYIHFEGITAATPKELAVNDRVNTLRSNMNPGTLLAIHGDQAWIRWDDGNYGTYGLRGLRRWVD